jgi:hypothetical protein
MTTLVDQFVAFAQRLINEDNERTLERNYPKLFADKAYVEESRRKLSVEYGRRYAKVVASDRNQRSVYCFLDMSNGDILKAEGWAKPAKHARGSLHEPSSWKDAVTAWGARYLR